MPSAYWNGDLPMIYAFIGAVCFALIVLAIVVNATKDLELDVRPQQLRPTSLTMQAADPEYSSES